MAATSLVSLASLVLCFSPALATVLGASNTASDLAAQLPEVPVTQEAACQRVNATIAPGICAECKASPHTLALNVQAYNYETAVTIIAQSRGESINCNRRWLKTTDNCWVAEWDLALPNTTTKFCSERAPELDITERDTTLKYKSECYANAYRASDSNQRMKMFQENTDLTLFCKSSTAFLKTTYDCFVEAQMLDDFQDADDLPDCGPQVILREPLMRRPDPDDTSCPSANGTTTSKKLPRDAEDAAAAAALKQRTSSGPNYLVNTTIGEDYAKCQNCPRKTCGTEIVYKFNQTVTIQCYSGEYLLTTDFCYLNRTLVDYQPTYEQFLFPACEDFKDGSDR